MDERARDEMVAAGHDRERIVVTGQPQFDKLITERERFSETQRVAVRVALGATDQGKLILFASQPIAAVKPDIGYNEHTVLRALIGALEEIATERDVRITLWIRPHPRETSDVFEEVQSRTIDIRVSSAFNAREAALAADLVTGMSSMLLMEACYLGCCVASLQPGLRGNDALPANDWGWSRGIYSEQEIGPTLATLLFNESERAAIKMKLSKIAPPPDATERVARLAGEMLGL
jgi:UDP-N-acetylglucosamine 2-epimerase